MSLYLFENVGDLDEGLLRQVDERGHAEMERGRLSRRTRRVSGIYRDAIEGSALNPAEAYSENSLKKNENQRKNSGWKWHIF